VAELTVVSDAAGRMRVIAPWFRSDSVKAVAIEDAVDTVAGVRAVHAYPRTASVVVWYSPRRCDAAEVLTAISEARHVPASLVPARTPRSADIHNADVVRMAIGAIALALLGIRRYGWWPAHARSAWPPQRRSAPPAGRPGIRGRAVDVIEQNYAMSITVNAFGLLLGAGGGLSPVMAAILHNASSVAVVANSSRLIRYQLAGRPRAVGS
jgi:cation transport ATPase